MHAVNETPYCWGSESKSVICSHLACTADGVKVESVLNTAPLLRSQRTSAMKPAPTSNSLPEASMPSGWVTAATNGATNAGYKW